MYCNDCISATTYFLGRVYRVRLCKGLFILILYVIKTTDCDW